MTIYGNTLAQQADADTPSNSHGTKEDRLILQDEVQRLVPVSKPTLWRWERDGKFPQRIKLSRNLVAWRRSEILEWIAGQGKAC